MENDTYASVSSNNQMDDIKIKELMKLTENLQDKIVDFSFEKGLTYSNILINLTPHVQIKIDEMSDKLNRL